MKESKIVKKIKSFDWSKVFKDGMDKESSKRVAGMVGFGVFLIIGIFSGFGFYATNNDLVLGGLAICAGLLGVSTFKKEA
jgi:hypothetical protein